jgi:hypothetical protein
MLMNLWLINNGKTENQLQYLYDSNVVLSNSIMILFYYLTWKLVIRCVMVKNEKNIHHNILD